MQRIWSGNGKEDFMEEKNYLMMMIDNDGAND